MSQYEEYNKMLNKLYNLHTDTHRIHIELKATKPLTHIQRKAIKHFVKKLKIQYWIIFVEEYMDETEETVTYPDRVYYTLIQGKSLVAKL